jgi:hypothetical protein
VQQRFERQRRRTWPQRGRQAPVSGVRVRQEPCARRRGATVHAQHVAQRSKTTRAQHRRDCTSPAKTKDKRTRKRCNNAGVACISLQRPRTSAALPLQQPNTHRQHHDGVAQRGLAQNNTQTAAFAAPSTHTNAQQRAREHAGKRASMLQSCQSLTSSAVSNVYVVCAPSDTLAPPSRTVSSRYACNSARSMHCRESEKRRERSECRRTRMQQRWRETTS